jgi:hypothetical protein
MPLVIDNPKLEALFKEEAAKQGRDPEEYTREVVGSFSNKVFISLAHQDVDVVMAMKDALSLIHVKHHGAKPTDPSRSTPIDAITAAVVAAFSSMRYVPSGTGSGSGGDSAADAAAHEREADPEYLLSLPLDERHRIMAAQAEAAAPLYEADLARPEEERELTAFTSPNRDPVLDPWDYLTAAAVAENRH